MTTNSSRTSWMALAAVCLPLLGACGSRDDTVVRIGDREVSKAEFQAYLKHKRVSLEDPKRLERTLDEYAERAALAAAIEKEKLLDAEAVKVELEELKKEMLISRYFEKLLQDRVGDDAVRNYYDSHAKDYEERKAHVAHVLLRVSPNMDETERKVRLTRAQEAYSKVRAGEDFGEIAKVFSEDRISNGKGGDIGWIKQGAIDPQFSEKVFALKPGEVSEPFLTQFGYHVVKLIEGPAVVKRPFESVAGDIRYQLRQKAKQAEVERLASKVKVEKKLDVLKSLAQKAQRGDAQAKK